MNQKDLLKKKCIPCEKPIPPLATEIVNQYLESASGWKLEGKQIEKEFKFKNFVEAMKFVNRLADVAENEQHHPDLFIHYNRVKVMSWTHVANGLTENDFILAAKVDSLTA